ncbi:MAG TPA: indolepyruvate oxidoreductase subunit beta [Bacteroidetes bacterium]|nr:indolepyruvate oxidoreductase subunit beta [bacterium BMS3Bbin04]HDO66549.1 indolepyruvate oxidoreductase subunit beta [Bacteroidota bacterium]HEX05674.1 indolepyruvate oxidoreductase subunit beta [Bacteroidota bacterium]
MSDVVNVLIVGVGGQGVVLASNILCEVALRAGYDVKKSEVHGMSQRGGVVTSHVRFGEKVYSPLISRGQSDILLGFEAAEALRFAHEVKEGGLLLSSTQKIRPPRGPQKKKAKGLQYPENALDDAKKVCHGRVVPIEAEEIANELGNSRLTNTILLGAVSTGLDISDDIWTETIKAMVPPKTIELNLAAFARGKAVVEGAEA